MVMIGDKIKLENGEIVEVVDIKKTFCGRYFISYKGQFLEGDMDFKVL